MMALACTLVMLAFILYIAQNGMRLAAPRTSVAGASIAPAQPRTHVTAPTPFMYRPFYGTQTIAQRTTSFVDHDKPWYVTDGVFVRYDGAKWTNVPIGGCTGGVNCYDGHDGYDLNLWFEPVLSVAPGTVIRAGWYNAYNHESAYGLWAAVDHHNGYATAYGHLSALMVSVGENVGTQWQLGTSGTTGSSTGPHLHLATYYLPNWSATDPFGWTGNYPDPNVVPDNYLWVNNAGTSYTIPDLSANGNAIYPGATLVDDGGTGWSSTGTWTASSSSTDINGNQEPFLYADASGKFNVFVPSVQSNSSGTSWGAAPGGQVDSAVVVLLRGQPEHVGGGDRPGAARREAAFFLITPRARFRWESTVIPGRGFTSR